MKGGRVELTIVAILVVVLLPLVYCALSHVPYLYVDSIQLTITGEGSKPPHALKSTLSSFRGKSLVSLWPRKVTRELEGLALVESARVKKSFPSTLVVETTLVATPALVRGLGSEEELLGAYVVRGSSLLPLLPEDWSLFEKSTLVVEIPIVYAQAMEKYGIDALFSEVMELVASLEGNSTLITRIKYDNNSSNSFGKMILELATLRAQIWLWESVSSDQVSQAIQLVQEDQRQSLSFLSSQTKRYDLYQGAMVRRN